MKSGQKPVSRWIHIFPVYRSFICRFWCVLEIQHLQGVLQTSVSDAVLCLRVHCWCQVTRGDYLLDCVCLSFSWSLEKYWTWTHGGAKRTVPPWKEWNHQLGCSTPLHRRWRFLVCCSASDSVFIFPGFSAFREWFLISVILCQRLPCLFLSRYQGVGWLTQGRTGFLENLWLIAANPPAPGGLFQGPWNGKQCNSYTNLSYRRRNDVYVVV